MAGPREKVGLFCSIKNKQFSFEQQGVQNAGGWLVIYTECLPGQSGEEQGARDWGTLKGNQYAFFEAAGCLLWLSPFWHVMSISAADVRAGHLPETFCLLTTLPFPW